MLASRKVVFSSFVLLGIVLGGCKLLKKGDADGGLDGAVEDAAPAAADTAAPVDADAGAAAAASATTATTVTRLVPKTDGGLSDAGAKLVDAGAVVVVVDAGAAPAPTTPTPTTPTTPTAPTEPGTCCCDVPGGAKTILTQKECMTTKKGQCVPLASCGLKFKRPGQK